MGNQKTIKWRGMVPVRVRGVHGHILQNQKITVDETIANNLLQDDFWEAVNDEPVPHPYNDKIMAIPDEPHTEIDEEKKEVKKNRRPK